MNQKVIEARERRHAKRRAEFALAGAILASTAGADVNKEIAFLAAKLYDKTNSNESGTAE